MGLPPIRSVVSPCANSCLFREMWVFTKTTGSSREEKGMGGQGLKGWDPWCMIKGEDSRSGLPDLVTP